MVYCMTTFFSNFLLLSSVSVIEIVAEMRMLVNKLRSAILLS